MQSEQREIIVSCMCTPLDCGASDQRSLHLQVADILCAYVSSQSDKDEPVVRLANPDVLKQHFEEARIPLEIEDGQGATPVDSLLAGVSTALQYSVRTGHPGFFNQLYARADAVSIAADWLAVAANTNVHTYEVAPVFTAVEVEVLSKLARCIGGEYAHSHDGLFAPGGSISNIYGTSPLHLVMPIVSSIMLTALLFFCVCGELVNQN